MVGIAMVREMGAVMTGITWLAAAGASFAAQLGTMQVNEEIDALTTLGVRARAHGTAGASTHAGTYLNDAYCSASTQILWAY